MTDSATPNVTRTADEGFDQDATSLDALRRDIDAADAEMHRLLIHRGEVIERLITAKKLGAAKPGVPGSAFRPDREADMMHRIAARHSGQLPLSIVEHIWREIIGTFTQLQAPYSVHAARAAEPRMRDLLRYYFGFSSPLVAAESNRAAVEAVARSGTDLAVVAVDDPLEERWWSGLAASGNAGSNSGPGAKVIAALPFLPPDTRLDLPRALVIGPADVDAPTDLFLYAVASDADASAKPPTGPSDTVLSHGADTTLVASQVTPADFAGSHPGAQCLGSFAKPPSWPQ